MSASGPVQPDPPGSEHPTAQTLAATATVTFPMLVPDVDQY